MPAIGIGISPMFQRGFNYRSYWATQPLTAVVEDAAPTDVVITFEKALDESSVPATTAFNVFGKTVSNVDITSNVLTLTVSVAFSYGDGIHILYTPPVANPLLTSSNIAPSLYITATNNVAYSLPAANLKFDYFGGDGASIPAEITIVGGNVTAIADRSVNGYDLTETGGGNTTHQLSVEGVGRGALVLGGTSYFLRTIVGAVLASSSAHTIITVYSSTQASDTGTFYMEGSTASETPLFRYHFAGPTGYFYKQHRDDASNLVNTNASMGFGANDGNIHIAVFIRNSTSHWLVVDGRIENATVKAIGTTTVDRMGFGALVQGATRSNYLIGKVFAVIGYEAVNYDTVIIPISRYYGVSLYPTNVSISFSSTIDTI